MNYLQPDDKMLKRLKPSFLPPIPCTNTTACGQVGKNGVAFLRSHCYTRSFGPRVTCKLGHPAHRIDSTCRQPRAAVGLTWGAGRLGKPLELCVCACPCEVQNRPSILMSYHKHCESHLGNCQTHDRHDSFQCILQTSCTISSRAGIQVRLSE
eukprot:COSAG01_NODE_21107_length_918_cov_0.659341_2_plen_153_part_00